MSTERAAAAAAELARDMKRQLAAKSKEERAAERAIDRHNAKLEKRCEAGEFDIPDDYQWRGDCMAVWFEVMFEDFEAEGFKYAEPSEPAGYPTWDTLPSEKYREPTEAERYGVTINIGLENIEFDCRNTSVQPCVDELRKRAKALSELADLIEAQSEHFGSEFGPDKPIAPPYEDEPSELAAATSLV